MSRYIWKHRDVGECPGISDSCISNIVCTYWSTPCRTTVSVIQTIWNQSINFDTSEAVENI